MQRSFRILLVGLAALAVATLGACASTGASDGGLALVPSQSDPALDAKIRALGRTILPPENGALYAPKQARPPYAGVAVVRDVRYGPNARNLLDVFTPEADGGGARPVLVFVHGGAFTRGDRRGPDSPYYDNLMIWAVRNGMVGVNMTYRLAPGATWPAAQEDIADALRWVRTNVASRGGDPAKVFLMGHSAGAAHVAQYVGHARFHIEPGSGLAGAILVSGIFDPSSAADGAGEVYFGADKALQAQRSALPGMAASRVPMLFIHAELDPDLFHQQADQARKALCVPARPCPPFLLLQGHGHMSEIYAVNAGDRSLSDPVRRFVACDAAAARALAPTGTLRVAVYPGSPTSLVRLPDGSRGGVALALGDALARTLGVPAGTVEFRRPAEVIEGLKAGQGDLTFTNATPARAREVDFTEPLLRLELGVLARAGAPIADVEGLDAAGLRVGVSRGSSSQAALGPRLKQAALVPFESLDEARRALADARLDAFATNKGILFELADQVPGARVLPGRWGLEHLALAVPKGREAGRDCLRAFGASLRGGKLLRDEAARAGLRGLAQD